MYYLKGEDIDGNQYQFTTFARNVEECKQECQEYLETLEGGYFEIFADNNEFLDRVDW